MNFSIKTALIVCALYGISGTTAAADEPAPIPASAPATSPADEFAPRDLAMEGLAFLGAKPALEHAHLKVSGWLEQSFTLNFDSPSGRVNALRVFDDRSNDYRFNQLALVLERVLTEGKDFDFGGKVELMYGSDARFIHETYLTLHQTETMQFDPVQFYGLVRLPVGNGLTVKLGKYDTTHGAEVIEAVGNPLYSHSFLFGYAIPFTHTGIQFDYPLTDRLSVYYGITFGWDTFGDTNSAPSHMVGLTWKATDKFTILANVITGPERPDNNADWRTVWDTTLTYQWTDAFSTALNVDWGNENNTTPGAGGIGAGDNWYGLAAYATHKFTPQVSLTGRGEYFRDETGSRTPFGMPVDLVELTVGLDVHPLKHFMNLRLRPEIRWDHAGGDRPFDSGTRRNQFTVGMDVILTF
jgi:hypothetical protein